MLHCICDNFSDFQSFWHCSNNVLYFFHNSILIYYNVVLYSTVVIIFIIMLCLCKFSESNGTFLYTRISIQRYWDCLLPSAYLLSLLYKICKCVCTGTTSRSLCLHYEYQNNKCKIQKKLLKLMYTCKKNILHNIESYTSMFQKYQFCC